MNRTPMTPQGYQKLLAELKQIKSEERPRVVREIEEARAHGDISENAEYHAAKEKQSVLMARMNSIETRLSQAEVIDPKTIRNDGRVVFGATVTLYDLNSEQETVYQIVGDDESNIQEKKIAISSPIARGLIGKREGDEVSIQTPKGTRKLEIITIEYI